MEEPVPSVKEQKGDGDLSSNRKTQQGANKRGSFSSLDHKFSYEECAFLKIEGSQISGNKTLGKGPTCYSHIPNPGSSLSYFSY